MFALLGISMTIAIQIPRNADDVNHHAQNVKALQANAWSVMEVPTDGISRRENATKSVLKRLLLI